MIQALNQQNIDNKTSSLLAETHHQSDACLVCFGGIKQGIGIPVFEFFNSLNVYQVNKIFVRDFSQAWYQLGLAGLSASVPQTVEVLKKSIPAGTGKLVFIGNSMGGFAALLFGTLLGAHSIHAFVPQTFIDPLNRLKHRDTRWQAQLSRMYIASLFKPKYWDIQKLLASNTTSDIHIYCGTGDRLDMIHARRMQQPNCTLHTYPNAAHELTRHLRDSGELDTLIKKSIF